MTSGRGLIPTTEEVLQNAGAFGAHLGFGSIAGYAAGKAMAEVHARDEFVGAGHGGSRSGQWQRGGQRRVGASMDAMT